MGRTTRHPLPPPVATAVLLALALLSAACSVSLTSSDGDSTGETTASASPQPTATETDTTVPVEEEPEEPSIEARPGLGFLGTPFSGDSLANLDVGGPSGSSVAYRFVAERLGSIVAFRPFIVVNTSRLGYAAGTGGTVELLLVPDDGAGLPDDSRILGRAEFQMNLIDGALPPPADTEEKRAQNEGGDQVLMK